MSKDADIRAAAALKASNILFLYSFFLAASAFIAFALSGFQSKAATALIVGGTSAAIMCACAFAARAESMRLKAIGIHIALLGSLALAVVCAWRAVGAYGNPDKVYLGNVLTVMAAGSAVALVALLIHKPPPKKRE